MKTLSYSRIVPPFLIAATGAACAAGPRERPPASAPASEPPPPPALSAETPPPPSPLWGSLEPGEFGVGFSGRFVLDPDRSFIGSEAGGGSEAHREASAPEADRSATPTGRPLRILLWYPARPGAETGPDARLTFGDYFDTSAEDPRFATVAEYLRERDLDTARRQFSPQSEEGLAMLFGTRVAAVREAAGADGRFPLLVHSLGRNDYQQESTVLWEFLASHGYAVAIVPQLGSGVASGGLDFTPADLTLQADDVAFTIDHLLGAGGREWLEELGLGLELGSVGIIGHSSGGMVGVIQAARDPRVRAVAGLDGSFRTTEGGALLDEMDFDPRAVSGAILNVYAASGSDLDLSHLERMAGADRYHVALGGTRPPHIATHFDFQNWPLYSVLTGVEDDRGVGARPAAQGEAFFLAACRLTLRFFDLALRADGEARSSLTGEIPIPGLDPALIEYRTDAAREGDGGG